MSERLPSLRLISGGLLALTLLSSCGQQATAKEGPFSERQVSFLCSEQKPGKTLFMMHLGGMKGTSWISLQLPFGGSWPDKSIVLADGVTSTKKAATATTYEAEGATQSASGAVSGNKYKVVIEMTPPPKGAQPPDNRINANVDISTSNFSFKGFCAEAEPYDPKAGSGESRS